MADAFSKEEQSGLLLVLYARFVVLAILLVWAISTARAEFAVLYAGVLLAFAALGAFPLVLHWYGVQALDGWQVFLHWTCCC